MKSRHNHYLVLSLMLGALVFGATCATAANAAEIAPAQTTNLTLRAGESYVIDGLKTGAPPTFEVLDNPHAMVVHAEEPGKLVLLGAERGHWAIKTTLANGTAVTYDVTVSAIRDTANPLKPGVAPAAMNDLSPAAPEPHSAAAAPAAAESTARAGSVGSTAGTTATAGSPNPPPASFSPGPAPAAAGASAPMPSQVASAAAQTVGGKFRNDPSLLVSGEAYSTEGVARSGGTHYLPADGISLMTGTSQVLDFQQPLRRVSIADTDVADVQVINPFQLNLIAHKPGFTTLAVWSRQGRYEERQVRIDPTGKQQVMLNCIVAELDRNKIENQGMNIQAALSNAGVTLMGLPGAVATPFSPQSQITSQSALGTVTTSSSANMGPGGTLTPFLLSQNLTYGLATQNGQWATQTFFQYLENHQLAKVLAEPHLLANSGEKAKFLSGGEIPIVISQALNTSIVFKQFGTSVVFLPTVVGVNNIELLVQPEVSQPDYTHGVQMFGFSIPAFVTRKASTMVRLRDDQTLIIAGLILHQKQETIQKVPYLGDIPLMGGLFRNTSWQDQETDLVMSVTPQIVRPLPTGGQVYTPTSVGQLTSREIATRRPSEPDAGRPRF
jgi:pilus assembly protein CpaC